MDTPKYKRILLKLSGEALSEADGGILDFDFIAEIGKVVKKCIDAGVEIGIVVGGGNIWRGRHGMDSNKSRSDHMGMLATVINGLALQTGFESLGIKTVVQTSFEIKPMAETYQNAKALEYLSEKTVVIFSGGTGCPYFSTDTAAALRAAEIKADVMLMAKNIDGIYTADPKKDPTATRYERLSYSEILEKGLNAIDSTAAAFGRDNKIPAFVFKLTPDNIYEAVMGRANGTIIE